MSEKITNEDGSVIYRAIDGREFKSRSGAWKHEKKINASPTPSPVADEADPSSPPTHSPAEVAGDTPTTDTAWAEFDMGISTDATDVIPAPLKLLTTTDPRRRDKMTAKELRSLQKTETALLKAGLSGIDVLLSKYGQGVTMDPGFEVVHSESSKEMVANAQQEWLNEKGVFITQYMGKGAVAGLLTTWYVGAPLVRIRKEAKKPMIKRIGGGRLLSRIPLIGRFFKKKEPENPFELPAEVLEADPNE